MACLPCGVRMMGRGTVLGPVDRNGGAVGEEAL